MNSRTRVLSTLAHREPDRVPFDLGSTAVTGIHVTAWRGMRPLLGLPDADPTICHIMQQLALVDEEMHLALRTDVRGARPRPPSSWRLTFTERDGCTHYVDEWGIERRRPGTGGHYYDLCQSPLADARTTADVDRHTWASPDDPSRFDGMREALAAARADGRATVLGGISAGMIEMAQALLGFERFYLDLGADPVIVEAICERILDLKMAYWRAALQRVGDLVDVVQEGDDFGGQNGLLMSRVTWRRIFLPRIRRLLHHIRACCPHARVLYHSCGSIYSILPDLIEAGVDILNPVQVTAADMDSATLKREFGDSIAFWGGGIDTQSVLPCGTVQQVRDEVRRRIDDLAPGGGFVFAAVHNIQSDVPSANLIAMLDALREFGGR